MPFELQDLYNIRSRVLAGDEVSLSELTEMIAFLRADREAKLLVKKSNGKTKKPKIDPEKLLNSVIG